MKIHMKNNASLILFVLFFGLTLSGCSGKEDSGSAPAVSTAGPARTLTEVPHPTKDPYGKYDPPITVKVVHTFNDGAFWFPPGDSIDSNIYTRRYERDLGIKYEFLWTSPGAQAAEKFNLMLSSGDLPDFLLVTKQQFEQLYSAGQLQDMTDAIIDYANDYLREHLTGEYQELLDCAARDGRYYGFGAGNAFIDIANVAWLRKDYMDALGLSEPKTIDELESFMRAMKNNNPAGLPPTDTFPLAVRGSDQGAWDFVMNWAYYWMFNSYPGIWYKNSKDEIEHGMFGAESRARTRTALAKAHEFYQKGYISPSFSTETFDLMVENLAQGRATVYFGDVWGSWWPLPVTLDIDPNADWLPVAPPQAGSEPVRMGGNRVNVTGILVTTKRSKYPEALVKMSNLFLDLNDDPAKMEFNVYNTDPVDANQIFLAYPLVIHNPAFNIDALHDITEAQNSGDSSNLCEAFRSFYDTAMAYEKNKDKAGWPAYRSYLKDGTSLAVTDKFIQSNMVVYNEYTKEPTLFMLENEPTVKKLFDAMAAGVISGALDIGEYDKFISQWDSIYGNTATKEVNDWYKNK
ncbi:MAG: extracellular solute-binding protein [Treponema sp.]|nr:extracellular solute-binding protein [Treponema sp.]